MDGQQDTRPFILRAELEPQAPVVVALGANLGEPKETFVFALRHLAAAMPLHRVSKLYLSKAMGPSQPDFHNAAVLVDFPEPLDGLLAQVQAIERAAGRVRGERWGPRTLDLDILWAGGRIQTSSSLTVPHPELIHRAFALRPMLDVFDQAADPIDARPYAELWPPLERQHCECVEGENWWETVPAN